MVVTVTNVNEGTEATVVTLSSLAPKVGVPLTATLDDPDGGEKDVEWQWSIDGASNTGVPGTPTETPDGDISGATSATYTPKINDVAGTLTATVMYADAVGSGRTGTKAAANAVVQDLAAQAPVFKPKPASRSVPENYATGIRYGGTNDDDYTHPNVGAVVTATDPNDDTLTYSLGGADMGSFSINQETGQITVKTATELNLEAKPTYMVTVTAIDPGGLDDSVDVTIKLTDVDEAPMIMVGGLAISGMSSVEYTEEPTWMPWPPTGSRRPDGGYGKVDTGGRRRRRLHDQRRDAQLQQPLARLRECPWTDMGTDNTYMVTLKASDGTYMDDPRRDGDGHQ